MHVSTTRTDGVQVVRIERPPANAVDLELARELLATLSSAEAGDEPLVLTGTGDFFSAGLDLKVVPTYDADAQREMILTLGRLVEKLYGFPRPVVAAVNGHAVAAGTLFTLACDYRIGASGDFQYGLTGTKVGIPYPVAAQAVIDAELAPAPRRRMLLGAPLLTPAEALDAGIVDELVEPEQVIHRALAMARELGAHPADAFRRVKEQLRGVALRRIASGHTDEADPYLDDWIRAP